MSFNEEIWLEQIRKMIVSTLSFGRCFVTLDKDNNPVVYDALDVTNWREGLYAIFLETVEGAEENDSYEDPREYVRVSFISGTTYYERFNSSGVLLERKNSTKFSELPVLCIGATNLDWDVDMLPLEGISTCALHIYKKSADLSYSEFSSCVPTLVMTGVDDDVSNKTIGGGVALSIPNDLAKVFYPQTDTNALQHVRVHIEALFAEAKTYGASLLGGDKSEVESAEAIRLRQGAAGASLSTLTRNIERAVNRLLELAGIDTKFKINFDLEENYMTPAEQSTLLDSWMNNAISYQTYFNNLQKAGIIEDERSFESEVESIEEEKKKKQEEMLKFQTAQNLLTETDTVGEEKKKEKLSDSKDSKGEKEENRTSPGRSKNLGRTGADYDKNA